MDCVVSWNNVSKAEDIVQEGENEQVGVFGRERERERKREREKERMKENKIDQYSYRERKWIFKDEIRRQCDR